MKPNMDEFLTGHSSFRTGGRNGQATKTSRGDGLSSCDVFVIDTTTNLREDFKIPLGNYTKKEMQKLRNEAIEKMVLLLISKRKKK